jgi:hypothetical protein
LPVIARVFGSRSGPGVTASTRLPLLGGVESGRPSPVRVHPVPSPVGRPRSLMRVATAGGPWSPARSIRRPSPSRRRTDRPGRLSCGFARIPSTFAGRAVPSGGCRPPGHPASAFSRDDRGTQAVAVAIALAVFVPRVSGSIGVLLPPAPSRLLRWRRRPCGSFVPGVLRTAHVPGPRPGMVLAAWPASGIPVHRRRPWDLLITLRSLGPALRRAGERAFYGLALGPTCRFADSVRREFHRSRDPVVTPGRWAVPVAAPGFWPRGPALAT